MAVLTILVLVAVLVTSGSVEGIRISIAPTTIVDGKTPSLFIRCDTEAVSNDTVYVIKIVKSLSTVPLALVDYDGTWVDTSIQQRATATGSITPAAGSNLVLTFTDAISCNDQGDYSCEYSSQRSTGMKVNQTLQATSDPINIEMVVRPTMFTYNVNDTVELMCSGNVGKPVVGNWVWETRDDAFGSTWTSLRPGLTPVDETHVTSGLCQMSGRSTLTFQVRMEDDNRMYRCYFRDSQHSGNFTFQVRDARTPGRLDTGNDIKATSTVTQGCARPEVRGQAVGAGLAVWALLTVLLTLEGQGHVQRSLASKAPPGL